MAGPDPDYLLTLLQELQAAYPKLCQLIGDDYFAVLACRYIKHYPPTTEPPVCFGEQLPAFMQAELPYARVPSLSELADFELALHHAKSVPTVVCFDIQDWLALSAQQRNTLALGIHPSFRMLRMQWNAPQIWQALASGYDVPEPQQQAGYYAFHRKPDGECLWRSIKPLEFAALESIYHGLNFAELVEELGHLISEDVSATATAENFMISWLEQGLLVPRC